MGGVKTLKVRDDEAGMRVDRWFRQRFPSIGHSRVQKWLRTGQVRIDGGRVKTSARVQAGQQVRVPPLGSLPTEPVRHKPKISKADDRNLKARVLHRDDDVLVIDKPAGLVVQGGNGLGKHLDAMLDALRFSARECPRLVHRLDKGTSGVLVLARNGAAARKLTAAFRSKQARKLYWAVVVGVPRSPEGIIDLALAKRHGRGGEKVSAGVAGGKKALTRYRVIDRAGGKAAWVAFEPKTGRTHQLRVHAVAMETPILGDGNFSTEVHAELNFAERQATRETYPQDEARLRSETGSWASDPRGQGKGEASGIPGAISNQAPVNPTVTQTNPNGQAVTQGETAQAQGPGTPTDPLMKTEETFNRNFELGREVSVTRDATGTVKRLSVAVALDNGADGKPRSPQEIAALEALVKGAVGFDQARGDVVALSSRSFVKETAAETPWYEADWIAPLARNVSALLVALLVIFGIGRPLLKRRAAAQEAAAADRAEQKQAIGQAISTELTKQAVANPADPSAPVTLDMISSTYDYAQRADLIRNFVKQDPDRAALVVRDLLRDAKKEKENA